MPSARTWQANQLDEPRPQRRECQRESQVKIAHDKCLSRQDIIIITTIIIIIIGSFMPLDSRETRSSGKKLRLRLVTWTIPRLEKPSSGRLNEVKTIYHLPPSNHFDRVASSFPELHQNSSWCSEPRRQVQIDHNTNTNADDNVGSRSISLIFSFCLLSF